MNKLNEKLEQINSDYLINQKKINQKQPQRHFNINENEMNIKEMMKTQIDNTNKMNDKFNSFHTNSLEEPQNHLQINIKYKLN